MKIGIRIKLSNRFSLLSELGIGSATAKVGICFIQS